MAPPALRLDDNIYNHRYLRDDIFERTDKITAMKRVQEGLQAGEVLTGLLYGGARQDQRRPALSYPGL